MKTNLIRNMVLAGLILVSGMASAKNISLTQKFEDKDVEANDGTHQIYLNYEGRMPKIKVEEVLATCKITSALNSAGNKVIVQLEMETQSDDGFNGCVLTIAQPSGHRATLNIGYTINN